LASGERVCASRPKDPNSTRSEILFLVFTLSLRRGGVHERAAPALGPRVQPSLAALFDSSFCLGADDDLWRQIKAGELTGFSIGGSAIRAPAR